MDASITVARNLYASNLYGVGKARLANLDEATFDALCELMDVLNIGERKDIIPLLLRKKAEINKRTEMRKLSKLVPIADVEEKESDLTNGMESKQDEHSFQLERKSNTQHIPPVTDDTLVDDISTKLCKLSTSDEDSDINNSLMFIERQELKLMFFNSLKLRLGRAGLEEQWLCLVSVMATLDVIMISEVPAEEADHRTHMLVNLMRLQGQSESDWQFKISEPSSARVKDLNTGNLDEDIHPVREEVHIAIVKHPLKIIETNTLHDAMGTRLDYAPFQIKFTDARFASGATFVVSSVHFPPASRANQRDGQIDAFFRTYSNRENAMARMNTIFYTDRNTSPIEREKSIHIIGGDFNCYPGEKIDLPHLGYSLPLLGSRVATSSGRKSYDNIVVDAFSYETHNISWDMLELSIPQNSSRGIIGLSDHNPIVMKIKDVVNVHSERTAATFLPPPPPSPVSTV